MGSLTNLMHAKKTIGKASASIDQTICECESIIKQIEHIGSMKPLPADLQFLLSFTKHELENLKLKSSYSNTITYTSATT